MNLDLFNEPLQTREDICAGVVLLRGFALPSQNLLLNDINSIITTAPLQKLSTPSGLPMSVTTTSCGEAGWVSDSYGYRYSKRNLKSQKNWPAMPNSFLTLAHQAAFTAGFGNFLPDSCLINCYKVGAKMSLHQDKDEKDFSQPIVSVSLGLPATFLIGGLMRTDKTIKIPLVHGDVIVWGANARLFFHGVLPIKTGRHALLGEQRINLTFRKAL
ncbi:MAG: DNA oxidative demethylase AlkB [Gammaproteobacteria bacterium]|nr:MAG: DNA oxidative demethylase AlkB [Gammaproteobacteria bacterium]